MKLSFAVIARVLQGPTLDWKHEKFLLVFGSFVSELLGEIYVQFVHVPFKKG